MQQVPKLGQSLLSDPAAADVHDARRRHSLDFSMPPLPKKKQSCLMRSAKYLIIAGMVGTWVAMSELIQNLQNGWAKPYFLSWFVHCWYMIFIIPWAALFYSAKSRDTTITVSSRYGFNMRRILLVLLLLSFIAEFCAYSWYLSLPRTTVAANNSIYQSMAAFVYVLSVIFLKEKVTLPKSAAVVLSVVGVVLISIAPQHTSDDASHPSFVGYCWLMGSVISFSVYEIVNKAELEPEHGHGHGSGPDGIAGASANAMHLMVDEPVRYGQGFGHANGIQKGRSPTESMGSFDDDSVSVASALDGPPEQDSLRIRLEKAMFALGIIGVCTLLVWWIPIPILHYTGVEPFELPPRHKLGMAIANSLMDCVYNGLLLFGILVTTPVFVSVGTMLVLPTSIIVGRFLHNTKLAPVAIVGVALVAVGFIVLNIEPATFRKLCARKPSRRSITPVMA